VSISGRGGAKQVILRGPKIVIRKDIRMAEISELEKWVEEMARWTEPESIRWCDGSDDEARVLCEDAMDDRELIRLHQKKYPGCYLHRSNPNDVARTEKLTFISTPRHEDVGPTNNWMPPADAKKRVWPLFKGAMKGRTMFVIPYLMGVPGSLLARVGIEITDSRYVVLSMRIMTRMGKAALDSLKATGQRAVRGLHSKADLNPERRFIMHFPADEVIWSVGSGYGGNALLGKKCFSLRIASDIARREGWLAEHMLIVGLESPEGETTYMAAAFPSACGKTNLAMLVPPERFKGWKVWTVGDDIAWMRWGEDGRLYAANPEAGFFGVAPLTSMKTNPNAMKTVGKNTIFVNTAMTLDALPWWEGMDGPPPAEAWDWRGRPWTPTSSDKAAHPNSRFTAPARQCPSISPHWEDPQGVPISAIIFGGRRSQLTPLVYESLSWSHGVYVGAGMATETTAAASDLGLSVRRDPMAMLPFCGYNMADYFAHWLSMEKKPGVKLPRIFHVNWFRKNDAGNWMWPGFGENLRVLHWIVERCKGRGKAVETPIGFVPGAGAIDTDGIDVSPETMHDLTAVGGEDWKAEVEDQEAFFGQFGDRLPGGIRKEEQALRKRLGS